MNFKNSKLQLSAGGVSNSWDTAPEIDWCQCAPTPKGVRQFHYLHCFLTEEHEQMLAELATRLEIAFDAFFKSK
jgi:hypothetical protein